jgi:hypothetical protein
VGATALASAVLALVQKVEANALRIMCEDVRGFVMIPIGGRVSPRNISVSNVRRPA